MGLGGLFTGAYYGRYDKTVHFFASAGLTMVLMTVVPLPAAAAGAFAVGLVKEFVDWRQRRSRIDWRDVAVNALGIATVALIAYVVGLLPVGRLPAKRE